MLNEWNGWWTYWIFSVGLPFPSLQNNGENTDASIDLRGSTNNYSVLW